MISTPRDDQRSLWPPLLHDDPRLPLDVDPLWLHDRKAPHGAGMAPEHMGTPTCIEIPDPDRAVRRATNEGIFARGQRPHSTFVALEKAYELASGWGVHAYRVVIGSRNDATMREDETGDHGGSMGRERDMLWLRVADPSCAGEVSRFEENLEGMWER